MWPKQLECSSSTSLQAVCYEPFPVDFMLSTFTTVPEPAMKRKSLATRAGEVSRPNYMARPTPQHDGVSTRAPSISTRQTSIYSSSDSLRIASNSSINGSRSSSTTLPRARTSPTHSSRAPSGVGGRTATASSPSTLRNGLVQRSPGSAGRGTVRRKGMRPPAKTPTKYNTILQARKQRKPIDNTYDSPLRPVCKTASIYKPATALFHNGGARDISIVTGMQQLSLHAEPRCTQMPTYIPNPPPPARHSPQKSHRSPIKKQPVKTRTTVDAISRKIANTRTAWDTKGRLEDVEQMHKDLEEEVKVQTAQYNSRMEKAHSEKSMLQEFVEMYKSRGE